MAQRCIKCGKARKTKGSLCKKCRGVTNRNVY